MRNKEDEKDLYRNLHTWNELRMLEMFTELSLGVAHVTSGADNVNMSITEVTITDIIAGHLSVVISDPD